MKKIIISLDHVMGAIEAAYERDEDQEYWMLDRGRKNDTEVLGGYDEAKPVGQVGGYEVAEDVRL